MGETVQNDSAAKMGISVESEIRTRLLASLYRSFAESSNDYPAILETIAGLIGGSAGDACVIRIQEEDGHKVIPAVFYHNNPIARSALLPVIDDLYQTLPIEEHTAWIENYMASPELAASPSETLRASLVRFPVYAVMVFPLNTSRRTLGSLILWRTQSTTPYSTEDQKFWKEVTDRAALAIDNSRLYADEVRRNRQWNALHDATAALLSTLDLEELLVRILDAAQKAIPAAERGVLFLVAPQTGRLEVRAISGFGDPRIRHTRLLQNNNANRSIRERHPLLIQDAKPEQSSSQLNPEADLSRSEILAPLVLGDEVLGTLSLSSSQSYAFDRMDLQLLVSFATTTTAAMRNAILHTELQKVAITDPLTGLYNRRGLMELGRHEVERFQRFGQPLSAIMLDIDHFKLVNDSYGHSMGDQVLIGLTERCRLIIRQVDIIARYGGEEFAIILPETDMFQASTIAERLRRAVEETPFVTEKGPITITISLGVSRARRNLTDLISLIEQSDAALYQAKQKGRNRVEII